MSSSVRFVNVTNRKEVVVHLPGFHPTRRTLIPSFINIRQVTGSDKNRSRESVITSVSCINLLYYVHNEYTA